ncbi:MAG: hypothetical protein FD123_3820 [Bacteroidetes bacterium]|nr:MAG: hypothetical protein FD123_3820 [Bacteroidota bacterium]
MNDIYRDDITLLEMLVPLLLVILLVVLSFRSLRNQFALLRGKYLRRNYVVIIGLTRIAMQMASQLAAQGRKVTVIAPGKLRSEAVMLRKRGVIVLVSEETGSDVLVKSGIAHAQTSLVATGNDADNLNIVELLKEIKHHRFPRHRLRILVHIQNTQSVSLMKDYMPPGNKQGSAEVIPFNEKMLAAQQVFDLNPPYRTLNGDMRGQNEESICVIGYNETARFFLVENCILSPYPGKRRMKIYLIAEDAAGCREKLVRECPYIEDFQEIIAVELRDYTFSLSPSRDAVLLEAVPSIDAVYCFGEDDSLVFRMAQHFHQLICIHTQQVRRVPFTICLPENIALRSMMSADSHHGEDSFPFKEVNFHLVHMISDTCTVRNLVDSRELNNQLAMAVNYFYSVKYEFGQLLQAEFRQTNTFNLLKEIENKIVAFRPKSTTPLAELEDMVLSVIVAQTKNSRYRVKKYLGISERWEALTERKKDSNRYVVRHIGQKLHYLAKTGAKEITPEVLEKQFHILAPLEHKRWSAEKLAAGFAAGKITAGDKATKTLVRDTIKLHDQLVGFEQLDQQNAQKDLDIFLVIPMLLSLHKKLTPP